MAEFIYTATDKDGKRIRGILDAESENDIIEKLRSLGYTPKEVTPVRRKAEMLDLGGLLKKIFSKLFRGSSGK